jgi:hypothetical protein
MCFCNKVFPDESTGRRNFGILFMRVANPEAGIKRSMVYDNKNYCLSS